MKIIRFLYRQMNLNTTGPDRRKIIVTLIHSLRMPKEKKSGPEWDESLSSGNLLWFEGECCPLDDYTLEQKKVVLDTIVPHKQITDMARIKTQRRQYKAKIIKAIAVERKVGHHTEADSLDYLINISDDVFIKESMIENLQNLDMNRHKQRMGMVNIFAKAHNKLVTTRPTRNATYLQEGILKIPHRWKVGSDVISPQDFIDFTNMFLTQHFPNYPIHALVVHTDEREKNESTGTHCHYFLSGQETVFGNWDLLKTQIEVVNQYQDEKNKRLVQEVKIAGEVKEKVNTVEEEDVGTDSEVEDEDALLPENCILTQAQMAVHGERLQQMFFDFVNENLLHGKGLHAEIAPEDERKSEESKVRDRKAHGPKSKREHNYTTRKRVIEEARFAEAREKLNKITGEQQDRQKALDDTNEQIRHSQCYLDEQQLKKMTFDYELKQSEEKIQEKQAELGRLELLKNTHSIQYVSALYASIYARTKTMDMGLDKQAEKFANNIISKMQQAPTPELKVACEQALSLIGDDVLLNEYYSSNDTSTK